MADTLFRVHFSGGEHLDVTAETPVAARTIAKKKQPLAIITKIKIVKGD